MEHNGYSLRDSTRVIDEVESQLDRLLQKRFSEVDRGLEELINREKEAAHRRKEEIEKQFHREREALGDYRTMVRDFEEERDRLLGEARDRFDKVLHFQAEIEGLAKSTVDEIKKVNDLQDRLEDLRAKTSEKAAFLKNDLREKFGIVAEVLEDEPKPVDMDLDQELEKLKKIKELLTVESAAASLGTTMGKPAGRDDLAEMETEADSASFQIPEIQDLIAGSGAPEGVELGTPEPSAVPEAPAPPATPAEPTEASLSDELEACRRSEPADGSGEIHYFQKDRAIVVDPEKLFEAVDKTLEEAGRLSLKLGLTESPKDQFFIKQELINWQEGLRGLLLMIIKMSEKSDWRLPRFTREILDTQVLRALLERLSMENWSNPEEFAAFSGAMADKKKAFQALIEPRLPYLRSLMQELEAE